MEFKVFNPKEDGFLKKIDWNFEELKTEVTEKAGEYSAIVYTDDQIKLAKKDRATLNKFKKALNDARKDIKAQVMAPYTVFESQIKELTGIVDNALENIDSQVKEYEEIQREEKKKKIEEIYKDECIEDLEQIVPLEKIFKKEWLNVTTTMKSIVEEIGDCFRKIDKELKLINSDASPYSFEMKEEYLKDFDFAAAQEVKHKLEETAKKKAVIAEQKKAEEEARQRKLEEQAKEVAAAGSRQVETGSLPRIDLSEDGSASISYEDPKKEKIIAVTFRVVASESQFPMLNDAIRQLKANSKQVEMIKREEL